MAEQLKTILLILDGLGDRPARELDGRTPMAAAISPNLDHLARAGINGLLYPMGPGLAPSSEMAHMALLGYPPADFPGRGFLEALGLGRRLGEGEIAVQANLAAGGPAADGSFRISQRDAECCQEEGDELFAELAAALRPPEPFRLEFLRLKGRESLLILSGGAVPDITDQDNLVDDCPLAACQPLADAPDGEAAAQTAAALNAIAVQANAILSAIPLNEARLKRNLKPLELLLLKWPGAARQVMPFRQRYGMKPAMIASSNLFRGLACYLGMDFRMMREPEAMEDLDGKLVEAIELLDEYDFVLVHTKAPDEAGHRKEPTRKRDAIEELDKACAGLLVLDPETTLLVVTADHATPSSGPLVHSGEAVPFLMLAATTGSDSVPSFDEQAAAGGCLGTLNGRDAMPLILNFSQRVRYLGSRPYPVDSPALPTVDRIEPLRP